MSWKIIIILVAWLTLLCLWIAGIIIYKPAEPRRRSKRWFPFLTCIILITVTVEYMTAKYLLTRFEIPGLIGYLITPLGIALIFSGLAFSIWSRATLGRFWSGSVAVIDNHPVIKDGPYAFVRHPIYTGIIAMLWGSFLLMPFGFLFFTASLRTVFLLWKAKIEEAVLTSHKGEEYRDYKKKVPGMLI